MGCWEEVLREMRRAGGGWWIKSGRAGRAVRGERSILGEVVHRDRWEGIWVYGYKACLNTQGNLRPHGIKINLFIVKENWWDRRRKRQWLARGNTAHFRTSDINERKKTMTATVFRFGCKLWWITKVSWYWWEGKLNSLIFCHVPAQLHFRMNFAVLWFNSILSLSRPHAQIACCITYNLLCDSHSGGNMAPICPHLSAMW